MATKTVYNKALLDSIILRDGATLVGEYEKLNSEVIINFRCKCGNEHNKMFRSLHKWGGAFCKICTNITQSKKTKITFTNKYGVDNPQKNNTIRQKAKETNLKKYGVEHTFQSNIVKTKIKATNVEKYGVVSPLQNENIMTKVKNTNLIKYGVDNPQKNSIIRQKSIKTNLQKYGHECSLNNTDVQKKIQTTLQKKYGVSHNFQAGELRDNIKQTFLKKYGVEHPSQNEEVFAKAQKNSKKFKNFIMPSGTVRRVQGYEPFALRDLITAGITEDQIKTDRSDVPRIKYSAEEKDPSLHQDAGTDSEPRQNQGKDRYYFPDIFIPHENRLIEVKSTWTYKCKTDFIKQKAEAAKAAGYNYEIRIYNAKGKLVVPDSC